MRKTLMVAALTMSVVMVASSAHADTQTYSGKYTGSLVGAGLYYPLGDPDLGDFGGVSFVGVEGTPVSIEIADASGGDVAWTVAQDLNGDSLAGSAGEPTVSGCGKGGSLAGSAVPFVETAQITVFIRSVARVNRTTAEVAPCPGVGTQGTVTLTAEA